MIQKITDFTPTGEKTFWAPLTHDYGYIQSQVPNIMVTGSNFADI